MQNAKVEPAKCSSHSSESESDPQQIPAHFENSSSTVDSTSNQIFTQATYEAPPKVKKRMKTSDVDFNKEKTNLIVNYLPQSFTDQEFFNLFSTVGRVNKARIIRHRQTGYSFGYGFIDMASAEDAERAIRKLNQYQIGHKRLKVAYSLPSGDRTRNINLYIKGVPKHWTRKDLEEHFSKFGAIRNARILFDPATQTGTGVGFLLYAEKAMAERACEEMSGQTLPSATEPVQISFARSQSQPPIEWLVQASMLTGFPAAVTPTASLAPVATSAILSNAQTVQPAINQAQLNQGTCKGRRYNPMVRPTAVANNTRAQQPLFVAPQQQLQQSQMFVLPYNQFGQQIQGLDLQALIAQQQAQTVNTSATPVSAAGIPATQASATTNFQQAAAPQQTVPQAQNLSQISQSVPFHVIPAGISQLAQPFQFQQVPQQASHSFYQTGVM